MRAFDAALGIGAIGVALDDVPVLPRHEAGVRLGAGRRSRVALVVTEVHVADAVAVWAGHRRVAE